MTRDAWRDFAITIAVGVALAIAAAWLILSLLASNWGDPPTSEPTPTAVSASLTR